MTHIATKPEIRDVVVQLPLGFGTVPLRPINQADVQPGMVTIAPAPYGTAASATSPFQALSFTY